MKTRLFNFRVSSTCLQGDLGDQSKSIMLLSIFVESAVFCGETRAKRVAFLAYVLHVRRRRRRKAAWQVVSDRREDYEKAIPEKVLRL